MTTVAARLSRAVRRPRAITMQTVPDSTTVARAVMTVAASAAVMATPAVSPSAMTGVVIAVVSAVAVRKVLHPHPAVILPTANRRLPSRQARCLCRVMRTSVRPAPHVDSCRQQKKPAACGLFLCSVSIAYSSLMPVSLTTFPQRSSSCAMYSDMASGVEGATSTPAS